MYVNIAKNYLRTFLGLNHKKNKNTKAWPKKGVLLKKNKCIPFSRRAISVFFLRSSLSYFSPLGLPLLSGNLFMPSFLPLSPIPSALAFCFFFCYFLSVSLMIFCPCSYQHNPTITASVLACLAPCTMHLAPCTLHLAPCLAPSCNHLAP